MLKFDNVQKSFGSKQVLKGVNFSVDRGEIVGLLASNGGGKTTSMRIALGLMKPDIGEVLVAGQKIAPDSVRGVGYMPEERGLYSDETVVNQLHYFARLHRIPKEKIKPRIKELLDKLEVSQFADSKVKELSLGNKQRIQIASALIHSPELLVLDEPFSGLDPLAVDRFQHLLREYADSGAAILFSSHQIEIVEKISDRVVIMKDGIVSYDGDTSGISSPEDKVLVHISLNLSKDRKIEDITFENNEKIESAQAVTDGVKLILKSGEISVGELMQCGLKPEEIREMRYEKNSLLDTLSSIYGKDT